jgi:hypothetical protein
MSDFSINVKLNGIDTAVSTIGELESALKATRAELKGVDIDSAAFEQLSEQARVLQREFKNSYKEATNFEQNLGQITESVGRLASTITSGFSIAMSAVSLFGGETKELSEEQVRAQEALTLALSASTIATNAARISEDIRNVGLGLQAGLVKLVTLLTGAQATATVGQTTATEGATVAQRILNATMAANPIGLVVAALATLVGAFIAFGGEAEKATGYVRDYNAEIDRTTKAVAAEIEKQKELRKLQGEIDESSAKGEAAKLKIRLDTQKKLGDLDQQALDNEKAANEQKLKNAKTQLDSQTIFVKIMMEKQKELTDSNIQGYLNDEQKATASLIKKKDQGLITEEQYYTQLIALRQKYFKSVEEGDQKDFDAKNNTLLDLLQAQKNLQAEQEILNAKRPAQETKIGNEITEADKALNKSRLDALKAYGDDSKKLDENRDNRLKESERAFEDFLADRTSLVYTSLEIEGNAYTVYNEDLLAGYDETLIKLEISRTRSREDAIESFKKEIDEFEKAQKARVDINNKRVISDKAIQAEVEKRNTAFYGRTNMDEGELFERQKNYADQITLVQEEKAVKIAQIDEVLKRELTFGDNDLSDSRKKLALDQINFEIDISNRKIALEKSSSLELIKVRQDLQTQQRVAELASITETINISRKSSLEGVQGTEDQKAKQRKDINAKADQDLLNAQTNFNLKVQEADKANSDELFNYRVQKLQEFVQIYSQFSSQISALLSSISESQRIDSENTLMQIRDDAANQTNAVTTEYNNQVLALQEKLKSGEISQAQYNTNIANLDKNLAAQTAATGKAQRARELEEKKKAFESDKKLKIAQAIMAGAMGALSAFTGAMQLGPIAGPIVGGILAALVVATTAIQVGNINKTKFDGGSPEAVTPVSTTVNTSAADTAATNMNQASGGGFTQFSSTLLNQGTGSTGGMGNGSGSGGGRVYVVESDITSAQRRVYVAESNATI